MKSGARAWLSFSRSILFTFHFSLFTFHLTVPIEIKELHIKVTVNAPGGGGQQNGSPAAPASPSASAQPSADKEAMVAECVEQVLQILQAKSER